MEEAVAVLVEAAPEGAAVPEEVAPAAALGQATKGAAVPGEVALEGATLYTMFPYMTRHW